MTSWDKYAGKASGWTEHEYARPEAYLSHRAELIRTLGPALHAGDVVLDHIVHRTCPRLTGDYLTMTLPVMWGWTAQK